jgi:hypothetical protein
VCGNVRVVADVYLSHPRIRMSDMSTQLRLLDGGKRQRPQRPEWRLDADTRRIGRQGIAAARETLERARDVTAGGLSKAG